jgi:hypothetical protein
LSTPPAIRGDATATTRAETHRKTRSLFITFPPVKVVVAVPKGQMVASAILHAGSPQGAL